MANHHQEQHIHYHYHCSCGSGCPCGKGGCGCSCGCGCAQSGVCNCGPECKCGCSCHRGGADGRGNSDLIAGTIQPIVGKFDPPVVRAPSGGGRKVTVKLTLTRADQNSAALALPTSVLFRKVSRIPPSDGTWTPDQTPHVPVAEYQAVSEQVNGTVEITLTWPAPNVPPPNPVELYAVVVHSDQNWTFPCVSYLQAAW